MYDGRGVQPQREMEAEEEGSREPPGYGVPRAREIHGAFCFERDVLHFSSWEVGVIVGILADAEFECADSYLLRPCRPVMASRHGFFGGDHFQDSVTWNSPPKPCRPCPPQPTTSAR